jgi:hypothetical protein
MPPKRKLAAVTPAEISRRASSSLEDAARERRSAACAAAIDELVKEGAATHGVLIARTLEVGGGWRLRVTGLKAFRVPRKPRARGGDRRAAARFGRYGPRERGHVHKRSGLELGLCGSACLLVSRPRAPRLRSQNVLMRGATRGHAGICPCVALGSGVEAMCERVGARSVLPPPPPRV